MDDIDSLRLALEAEKSNHLSNNKMFLDLLRVIWNDMDVFTPPSPEVYGKLKYYAESWGWD